MPGLAHHISCIMLAVISTVRGTVLDFGAGYAHPLKYKDMEPVEALGPGSCHSEELSASPISNCGCPRHSLNKDHHVPHWLAE